MLPMRLDIRRLVVVFALLAAGPAAAQERRGQDTRIHLEAATFDPLRGPGPIAPELRLLATAPNERWIVQFRAPLTREQRAQLEADFGLKLRHYVPNLAYLERVPADRLARLRQHALVRAAVPYQPAYKISPRIGKTPFRTEERRRVPGLWLRAILFEDADPQAAAASLRQLPGVSGVQAIDVRQIGAPARIEFRLADRGGLPAVARLDAVRFIEEVAEQIEDNGNSAGTIQSGTPGTTPVWDRGIHGEGQIVGVVDSGNLDINHCSFRDPVNNTPSPTHRKVLEVRGGTPTGHATFVAGIVAGDDFNNAGTGLNRGNAWAARLVSGRSGEGIANALVSNRAQGATIHTNSWHDNTAGAGNPATYNQTAADVDAFTFNDEDHLVLGSMGNNGEEQGPPGTAKNAVGVNAARRDPNEMQVGDGNPGPTADGRRKPDVVTPGCLITSSQNGTVCTLNLSNACATSWATPAAAATSALIRQYYAEGWHPSGTARPQNAFTPTGALVKATLLNGTIDMTGVAGYPANNEGWGLARLENVLFFPGSPRRLRAWDVRHADGLGTGEFHAYSVNVASNTEPLRVTLAWSDAAGTVGATVTAVNDLDLSVIAPDGTTFLGNVFAGGQSTAGGAADVTNNVEQVLVNAPAPGTWTIRVGAPAVNVGTQGYAVVATARTSAPKIQVPGPVAFGDACVGSGGVGALDVCNTGLSDLVVGSITSSNPRFTVTTPSSGFPVTISHDFCFPFQVRFDPTADGAQTATLTVNSNDPGTPAVAVTASGAGSTPDVKVTGSPDFGVVSAWGPGQRTFGLCNVGECPLALTGAALSCPDFSIAANPLPATLSSGSCVDLVVGFTPVLPGRRSCTLTVNSDDPDTPAVARTLTARTPPALSLHAGYGWAHAPLSNTADDGSTFDVSFVQPVRPKWAFDLRLGLSRFDGQAGQPDTKAWRLGANAKFTFNPGAPLRVFVNAGPDLYHFDAGSFEGGFNAGLGLNLPAGRRFSFEATYNYNRAITPSPDLDFSQVQLGMLVSF
jgi:hypothetical protein